MMNLATLLRLPQPGPVDAEQLGRRMTALFRVLDGPRGLDLPQLAHCLLQPLGMVHEPIGMAGIAAAEVVACWGGLPYHSARHHAEVAINATVLMWLAESSGHPMPARRRAIVLTACLSHDYLYKPNAAPFEAEHVSAEAMDAIARGCGVAQSDRHVMHSLILATAPEFRPFLLCAAGRPNSRLPKALRDLLTRPNLASSAAILSDADLLSSAGLSVRWHQVQHARLEREMQRPISHQEDLNFLNNLIGPTFLSEPGRCFAPNLLRIKAVCTSLASKEP